MLTPSLIELEWFFMRGQVESWSGTTKSTKSPILKSQLP